MQDPKPRKIALKTLLLPLAASLGLLAACGERVEQGAPGEPRTGDACVVLGESLTCGDTAMRFCDAMADETDLQWGPCFEASELPCQPGEVSPCDFSGEIRCELAGGAPDWVDVACEMEDPSGGGDSSTPLVLRFDDAPVQLVPMGADGFDIDGLGQCDAFDWPTPETPWLAMDRDFSGGIDSGAELFGSGTHLVSGRRASNGFEALAELDSDHDGAITPEDARFHELRTWADHDGDRMGSGYEVGAMGDVGLVRIDLDYRVDRVCDARGNCGVERASFVYKSASGELKTGEVVDLHLACQ